MVVAGVSTRAIAESAARAGFDVTAIDAFADLDQHPGVRALSLPRDFDVEFSAAAAARAAASVDATAAAYVSNFENHPTAVEELGRGRSLWGNSPEVLRRARDPWFITSALRTHGLPALALAAKSQTPNAKSQWNLAGSAWMIKPLASGGGHHVRPWVPGEPVPDRSYVQELVDGVSGSIVFVAAKGRAVPLGVSRQIVGDRAFGSAGYRYCGNILASAGEPGFAADTRRMAQALADAVAAECDLIGVNGIDFVVRDGLPYLVEVNPRWTASMELVERAHGISMFAVHADACEAATLPPAFDDEARVRAEVVGKAIVFARHDVTIGDSRRWLADDSIRDVPHPGERIGGGRPVCTMLASGANADACYDALVRRAQGIYRELGE